MLNSSIFELRKLILTHDIEIDKLNKEIQTYETINKMLNSHLEELLNAEQS